MNTSKYSHLSIEAISETVKKLRNKQRINLYDSTNKVFIAIQFNKKEKGFVCWERWVSKDRNNWINHNLYLSIKDVLSIRNDLVKQRLLAA